LKVPKIISPVEFVFRGFCGLEGESAFIRVHPWLNSLFWAFSDSWQTSIFVIDAADFGFSGFVR